MSGVYIISGVWIMAFIIAFNNFSDNNCCLSLSLSFFWSLMNCSPKRNPTLTRLTLVVEHVCCGTVARVSVIGQRWRCPQFRASEIISWFNSVFEQLTKTVKIFLSLGCLDRFCTTTKTFLCVLYLPFAF